MSPQRRREVERLFQEAARLAPGDRVRFLDTIDDSELRVQVASLLISGETLTAADAHTPTQSGAGAAMREPTAGLELGHFRVVRELGRGGMGVVYLAEDLKLGRQVALKVLPPGFDKDGERLRRLEREARMAAGLNHPNVVTVYEIGVWEGRPFIAAEFVEGETLADTIVRGRLPEAQAAAIAMQILAALAAAHGAGIVHRDLKPANIMVRPDGTVKVLDFGLARSACAPTGEEAATLTQTVPGRILGTPAYMSPEQWEGKPADARSDIYAFGCILCEMLTGRRPGSQRERLKRPALEKILGRCLEREPDERWQSAAALQAELARAGRRSWKAAVLAAASTAAALIAIAGWQRLRPGSLSDQDVVVLAEFANRTGDQVFDGTLRQSVAIQLEQSPFLKIMDDTQIAQDLRLMGRSPSEPITSQIAREICVRDAAAASIEGEIAGLGSLYVVSLHAVNCKNGATLARERSQARDKEHVLEAVDKAATRLRAKLGESLASIDKLTRPLDQFTTSSLEALQSYSLGYTALRQGRFFEAIPFFRRSAELDPNFAWAYETLSIAYNNAGDIPASNEFQRKAFELKSRVSEFERLFITSRYYWQVAGDLDKAIDAYRVSVETYPRYWGSHSELSLLYGSMGQFEQAVEEAETAIRLEPRAEAPRRNLARAYIGLDRFGDAAKALAEAHKLGFGGAKLHGIDLEVDYLREDAAAAVQELAWFSGRPEEYLSFGAQAVRADALGRRKEASALYRRAADLAQRHGLKDAADDYESANTLAEAATGNCRSVTRMRGPGLALALCGDATGAERLAAATSRQQPNRTLWNAVQLPAIRAAIDVKSGDPEKVFDALAPATSYERASPEVLYLRAVAEEALGKPAEAAAEYRTLLDHPGANRGVFYGLARGKKGRRTDDSK
jgi:tetratricopeptide (TPR) repeat protein/predicted Ser/Thr protein kinase